MRRFGVLLAVALLAALVPVGQAQGTPESAVDAARDCAGGRRMNPTYDGMTARFRNVDDVELTLWPIGADGEPGAPVAMKPGKTVGPFASRVLAPWVVTNAAGDCVQVLEMSPMDETFKVGKPAVSGFAKVANDVVNNPVVMVALVVGFLFLLGGVGWKARASFRRDDDFHANKTKEGHRGYFRQRKKE